jgi:hypothetical protein
MDQVSMGRDTRGASRGVLRRSPRHPLSEIHLRVKDWTVRLATDLPSLEACLSLERRASHRSTRAPVGEPTAVPYCEFLMAVDSRGVLQGVCRLLPRHPADLRHSLPGSPEPGPGPDLPREFAPLLTALRYSSQYILEVGEMTLAPGGDQQKACATLWDGIEAHMALPADGGSRYVPFGYVLGSEYMPVADGLDSREIIRSLVELHGLHPDLRSQSGLAKAPDWIRSRPFQPSPAGTAGTAGIKAAQLPIALQEALARGCNLMGPPRLVADPEGLEFHWVASCEMLGGPD